MQAGAVAVGGESRGLTMLCAGTSLLVPSGSLAAVRALPFWRICFPYSAMWGTNPGSQLPRYEPAAGKRPLPLVVPAAGPVPLGSQS